MGIHVSHILKPLLLSSPSHPSGSSQCTSPEHPVSCIKPGLVIYFTYDNIHVSMLFSQIIPPSPSPTESKSLFFTSVSLLLSHIQGHHYHLSKFHIYALIYGNPLQYSCLENPMEGGAWQATVHGVAKSWAQLSDFTITILYWCFSFWLTSLCIIGFSFIHLIRTDSNVFFLRFFSIIGYMIREVAQSCPTLCNPMDCSLPGSSVHGIFQARVLEWVAISFSVRWLNTNIENSIIFFYASS